jgi:hypothetical protein
VPGSGELTERGREDEAEGGRDTVAYASSPKACTRPSAGDCMEMEESV